MALDDTKNFCKVTVSTGYTSTDTSIDLISGDGAKLPTPPFNLVWYNETDYPDVQSDPNKEIVRVTAVSGDTLTVTRGQEGTTAVDHNLSGKTYKMINSITKKMIDDINSHIIDTSNPHQVTASQVGAITKVEDDTNPKLGGDLDINGHKIGENKEFAVMASIAASGGTYTKVFQISHNYETVNLELKIIGWWYSDAKKVMSAKFVKSFGILNNSLGTVYSQTLYDIGFAPNKIDVSVAAVGSNNQFSITLTNNGSSIVNCKIIYKFFEKGFEISEV